MPQIGAQRLAGRLVARMPWLSRGRHIGHLSRALDQLGITDEDWTTADLVDALARHNRDRGLYSIPPSLQRSPVGLLVAQLREALAGVLAGEVETPGARRRRLAAERAEQAGRDRAERAAVDAGRATPDQVRTRVAAVRDQLRAAAARRRPAAGPAGPPIGLRPRAW